MTQLSVSCVCVSLEVAAKVLAVAVHCLRNEMEGPIFNWRGGWGATVWTRQEFWPATLVFCVSVSVSFGIVRVLAPNWLAVVVLSRYPQPRP